VEKDLQSAVSDFIEAIKKVADAAIKMVKAMVRAISDGIHTMLRKRNPRAYYLAYHGPTKRIRKKNRTRLWREFFKETSYNET
jgi:hypothetical protein